MEFQCIDRECFVKYKLECLCIAYEPDSSPNCSIPCRLEFCSFRKLHEVLCAVYHCTPFETTTTTSEKPSPEPEIEVANIISYCFNAILAIICLLICGHLIKKIIKKRQDFNDRVALLNERQTLNNPVVRFQISSDFDEVDTSFRPGLSTQSQKTAKRFKVSFENFMNQSLFADGNENDQETASFQEVDLS